MVLISAGGLAWIWTSEFSDRRVKCLKDNYPACELDLNISPARKGERERALSPSFVHNTKRNRALSPWPAF